MFGFMLGITLLMIMYGVVRYGVAKWRRESNPSIHVLWIPAAAFFFAGTVSILTWVIH